MPSDHQTSSIPVNTTAPEGAGLPEMKTFSEFFVSCRKPEAAETSTWRETLSLNKELQLENKQRWLRGISAEDNKLPSLP